MHCLTDEALRECPQESKRNSEVHGGPSGTQSRSDISRVFIDEGNEAERPTCGSNNPNPTRPGRPPDPWTWRSTAKADIYRHRLQGCEPHDRVWIELSQ